jgi:thiamine biosynthesis lipoprotein
MTSEEISLNKQRLHTREEKLMGNRFSISALCNDARDAEAPIQAAIDEIRRIESLLTTFSESSQVSHINREAGTKPVQVDKEVFDLILRSQRISELTQGAFDISYGSIDKSLWNFDVSMTSLPSPLKMKQAVRLINYRNIILDHDRHTVSLKEKGMRIGFGGIGKGYAALRAKAVMQQMGVNSGIVNASGDLTVWGEKPYTIGIADPSNKGRVLCSIDIRNMSVATSGNYEKFAVIDGKRYSHTIDPKTGYPVTGIKSVTVIASNAEIADAMATPVMVMGCRAGLDLINQLKGIECIIIDDNNRIHTSKGTRIR